MRGTRSRTQTIVGSSSTSIATDVMTASSSDAQIAAGEIWVRKDARERRECPWGVDAHPSCRELDHRADRDQEEDAQPHKHDRPEDLQAPMFPAVHGSHRAVRCCSHE